MNPQELKDKVNSLFNTDSQVDSEKEQKQVLAVNHAQWLQNPVTQHYLKILTHHREDVIKAVGLAASVKGAEAPDTAMHGLIVLGSQLATCDKFFRVVTNTEQFINSPIK